MEADFVCAKCNHGERKKYLRALSQCKRDAKTTHSVL